MNKFLSVVFILAIGISARPATVLARGFGGFHGGGFSGGSFGGGGFDRSSFGGASAGFSRGSFGGGSSGGFDRSSFGGGYSGGFDRSSGFGGSYGGADRGSFGGSGLNRSGNYGGYHADSASAGGFRSGEYGASLNRGELNSFLGLPTDGGFHAAGSESAFHGTAAGDQGAAAWRGGTSGHVYQGPDGTTIAHGSAGVQGAGIGPNGAAAGGKFASGTAVETPNGSVYTHGTTAGRGVAAGPDGVEGGRYASTGSSVRSADGNTYSRGATAGAGFAAGPNGAVAGRFGAAGSSINGSAVAGRGYAAYGTHAWSPTYCHAQAIACNGWCAGRGMYTAGWCAAHPWAWRPAAYAAADWAAAAWGAVAWSTLGPWLGCAQPYSYDYGNDIVYQDNSVYYGGQPAGTAQQYYEEASSLADSTTNVQPSDDQQWLPLGVFGLMEEGKKTPSMIFQLAVDKNGVIRGNYFDQATQTNQAVTGAVDKKSERVAWRVSGGKGLVVETGLENLTMSESTALVHYGADHAEQELLVRMKQPAD